LSPLPKVSNSLTSTQRFRRADSSSATASSEKVPYRAENNFLEDAKHAPHAETQLLLQLQLGRTTTPKPFGGKNQKKEKGGNRKARSQWPLPALPQSSVAAATKFLWCLLLLREKPDLTSSFLQQNEFGLKTLQSQL